MYSFETLIDGLPRVGPATKQSLHSLGIRTVGDLLHHIPFRYDDFSNLATIESLKPHMTVTIKGQVVSIEHKRSPRKRLSIIEAFIEDETGSIKAVWFNQPFLMRTIRMGDWLYLSGTVDIQFPNLQFTSPVYEKVNSGPAVNTNGIVPVYSLSGNLTQKYLRTTIQNILKTCSISDWLPDDIRSAHNLMTLSEALHAIHAPKSNEELEQGRDRLKFEELFLIQLKSHILRLFSEHSTAPTLQFKEKEIKEWVSTLPFTLTDDQRKSAWQLCKDLEQETPMNRLLEGDVGSGKTVVAALAMLNCALNGYQAVLMAPTEILARQHYHGLQKLLNGVVNGIAFISGSESSVNGVMCTRQEAVSSILNGDVSIVVGTHALFQDEVQYHSMGLVVVDEQHRFGVEQRKRLKEKNTGHLVPHFLSMTATPIPRSLALIIYGDLDVSIIREMPKGRKKVTTEIIAEQHRDNLYRFISKEVDAGRQVFVICPLIDPSDTLGVTSATHEYQKLQKKIFPTYRVGLLHGKLKPTEKEEVMRRFNANELQILVSTSVVEVGVDVPNATVMVIEGAERFGLAQLHQFRGRVGRGEHQSYCFLCTSDDAGEEVRRLAALVSTHDGFALAEYDLQFRGPGEVYGVRQSGVPDLKIASLTDVALIQKTKEVAQQFVNSYDEKRYPELGKKLGALDITVHAE